MKKLMLGLMMAFAVTAEAEVKTYVQIGNLKYDLDTEAKTATICGYDDFDTPLTKIDVGEVEWMGQKYTVTAIGEGGLIGCKSLTSVSLPNVATIGERAFGLCGSLKEVSLPNATVIGESAFSDCGLTSITLPNAKTIEPWAFAGCSELKKIYVNETMKETLRSDRSLYGVNEDCQIISDKVVFEPHPVEHSTATIYTNGVEVTDSPIEVLLNATVEVVFTTEEGYCFEDDHSTVQTNAVTATDDPTKVDGPMVVKIPSLEEDETQQAKYEVKEAEVETNVQLTVSSEVKVLPSVTLKSGNTVLDQKEYEYACEFYGIPKQTEPSVPEVPAKPTPDDFKAVSKDAQVIQNDEIAVKKESIAAPSAGTVKVEDNKVQLGVTVLKTSDLTAEKKEWGEVTLTADDVKVVDGKVVISVPVDSASGFMVIQTKDAAK